MPIPLFILERIKTRRSSGEHMADVFTKLAYVLDQAGRTAVPSRLPTRPRPINCNPAT